MHVAHKGKDFAAPGMAPLSDGRHTWSTMRCRPRILSFGAGSGARKTIRGPNSHGLRESLALQFSNNQFFFLSPQGARDDRAALFFLHTGGKKRSLPGPGFTFLPPRPAGRGRPPWGSPPG